MLEKPSSAFPDADRYRVETLLLDRDQPHQMFREALFGVYNAILKYDRPDGSDAVDFAHSVIKGLSVEPRTLECRFLYDSKGSALFDLITQQPEYYLTRKESEILAANACKIRDITGSVTLVELGSGSSVKTDYLLRAWLSCYPEVRYVPVDVSESALSDACQSIVNVHLAANVTGVNADYREILPMIREASPAMVLFLGSTIGNFSPEDESCFLLELASALAAGDHLLIGVDLVKDASVIDSAYNDEAGVTAEFTRNLFARMNRELGSNVDLSAVQHVACYNPVAQQVEISARFTRHQRITLPSCGLSFAVDSGEMIRTEISRKYRLGDFVPYMERFGFETEAVFTDADGWFALVLLRRNEVLHGSCRWSM